VPRNLRTLAAGKPCALRLPGICNHDEASTVLAHIRRGHTAGGGMKPADINAVPLCSACHDAFDGRKPSTYTRTELDAEMLRAHVQWLDYLAREEIIVVVAA
jgi:hypothetical protein